MWYSEGGSHGGIQQARPSAQGREIPLGRASRGTESEPQVEGDGVKELPARPCCSLAGKQEPGPAQLAYTGAAASCTDLGRRWHFSSAPGSRSTLAETKCVQVTVTCERPS